MKKTAKRTVLYFIILAVLLVSLFTITACGDECTEHEWGVWLVNVHPNWTDYGYLYRNCANCYTGQTYDLPPLASSWYTENVIKKATCTEMGVSEFVFGEVLENAPTSLTVNTPTVPHDLSVFAQHDAIRHEVSCSVCQGYKYEDHNLINTVTLQPTCTSKGKADVYCSSCGYAEEDKDIEMLSHDYVTLEALEATCKSAGHTAGKSCSVCGTWDESVIEIPIAAHLYESGVCKWCPTKQPITVTYVYNDTESEEKNKLWGDKFEYLDAGSDNNRIFLGWFTSDGTKYTIDTTLTSSVTLYAKWDTAIHITTREQFLAVKDDPSASYYLDADIDMKGALISPITLFTGVFDGYSEEEERNYVIKNFIMTADGTVGAYGIFSTNKGIVKNVTFKDFTFSGNVTCGADGAIGGVVGINDGTLSGVVLDNVILAPSLYKSGLEANTFSVGLLVGRNAGQITDCEITGEMNVFVEDYTARNWYSDQIHDRVRKIGGAVGDNLGKINKTYASVEIVVETKANNGGENHVYVVITTFFGGFVGHNRAGGEITHSYSDADLTLKTRGKSNRSYDTTRFGGFVGFSDNTSTISECFAKGTMTGNAYTTNRIGGFVGENTATASISSSYAEVDIAIRAGSDIISGGFVGYNTALVQNSYSTGELSVSVVATLGGFVGYNAKGGTVTKTYTTSSISATNGTAGVYAGVNDGIVSKSYTVDSVIFKPGDSATGNMSLTTEITEIGFSRLISEDHLKDNLYWDLEGWYVGSDNNPFLEWEFLQLHTYGEPDVIHPTCTDAGFTVYECKVCKNVFITDIIAPLRHNNVDEYEKDSWRAPTHTESGFEAYVCEHEEYGISHTYTVTIEPLGHDTKENISCAELIFDGGKYYHKCSCSTEDNEVLVEVSRKDLNHRPKNVPYTKPSCGLKIYDEETDSWYWDYTESHVGNTAGRVCEDCGYVTAGCEIIKPHVFVDGDVLGEASCKEAGSQEVTCSICEYKTEKILEQLDHTYEGGVLKCTVCEEERYVIDQSFTAISSVSDLKNMIQNGNYYLTQDIDLENVAFEPLFSEDDPFVGVFLGQGYAIKNLVLSVDTEEEYLGGIFAAIGASGKVVGLNVENVRVAVENVNDARVGIIAGINNGEILLCNVKGEIDLSFLSLSTSQTVGEFAHSFNFVFGGIAAENGRTGELGYCEVTANFVGGYEILTNLAATNVSGYFSQLINNTKITNHTNIAFGGFVGTNRGKVVSSSVKGGIMLNMTVASVVGGINRGRTFTYINLSEGGFCGINTGEIADCQSTEIKTHYHDKTAKSFVSDNCITVLGVALKQEYYEIVDNTVFEEHSGLIGQSTPSGTVDGLEIFYP